VSLLGPLVRRVSTIISQSPGTRKSSDDLMIPALRLKAISLTARRSCGARSMCVFRRSLRAGRKELGAKTIVHLAASPDVAATGGCFVDCREAVPSCKSHDDAAVRRRRIRKTVLGQIATISASDRPMRQWVLPHRHVSPHREWNEFRSRSLDRLTLGTGRTDVVSHFRSRDRDVPCCECRCYVSEHLPHGARVIQQQNRRLCPGCAAPSNMSFFPTQVAPSSRGMG
jgi:hypothetical protein